MLRSTARGAVTVLALIVTLGMLSTIVAQSASADTVASKKAQAAQIAAQLERLQARESVLDEAYNQARVKAGDLTSRTQAAEANLARTTARAQSATAALRGLSLAAYMQGGLDPSGSIGGADDPARAEYYLHVTANNQKDAIDALHAAKQTLADQRAVLASERDQARAALAGVNAKRNAVAQAADAESALLAQVKGDLAKLVAAEQARLEGRASSSHGRSHNIGTPPSVDVPAPNPAAAGAVSEAKAQLGKPYQWGGAGPDSFDCSGLTMYSWAHGGGRSLPHSAQAQYGATSHISLNQIAPGDLLFFGGSTGSISHVGIYVGGGEMIEAPHSGAYVRYSGAYRGDLVAVGRVN